MSATIRDVAKLAGVSASTVSRVINELLKSGADVVHSPASDVHVSGH